MTFWELARAFLRHWPVVVLGALCTVAAVFVALSDDGVYFTRTEVVFLAPTSSLYPNALRTQSEDIIDTAGIVAKRLTGPGKITKFSSPDVTLIGMGVRDGWSLRLPDTGGQWATNYATQTLILDIVGSTEKQVRLEQDELVRAVQEELNTLQREAGVDPINDITAITAPQSTVIYHVEGSTVRTAGMTAVLGLGGTIAVVLFFEYRRKSRRNLAPAWTDRGALSPAEST